MKKLLLSTVLALGWFAAPVASHAQTPANCGVNFTPVVGVNCANIRQATYIATINALVPVAAATDFFCISGATSAPQKAIHIRRVEISGKATTLITTPISFRRLSVPDTGTLSTAVSGPRGYNPANPTSTAVIAAYDSTGGNPTSTGTSALFKLGELTLGVSATSNNTDRLVFQFGTPVDAYSQGIDIPVASTNQFCLNAGAATIAGGALYGYIEWSED